MNREGRCRDPDRTIAELEKPSSVEEGNGDILKAFEPGFDADVIALGLVSRLSGGLSPGGPGAAGEAA